MYIISQISVKAQTSLHILRGSRKFCQRGSDFDNVFFLLFFFLVDEGRDCRTNDGPTFKETKSATMNIFRFFYFLFKSFVKVELNYVFTINMFIRAENCAEK